MKLQLHYARGPLFRLGAELAQALEHNGCVVTDRSDVALHLAPSGEFVPIEGVRNVLWAMDVVTPDLTPEAATRLRKASAVLTTGSLMRELLTPITQNFAVPAATVALGFNPRVFSSKRRLDPRRLPGDPFRVLWVGELDHKGELGLLGSLWSERFADQPWIQLTVVAPGVEPEQRGNVTFWPAPLSARARAFLLHQHHAMLSFSHLDRVGLTELEALATGLPLVTSAWAPPIDYPLHSCATVADYELQYDRHGKEVVTADPGDLGRKFERLLRNYTGASKRAHRVAQGLVDHFAWGVVVEELKRQLTSLLDDDTRVAA